jgi:serine protease Do
LRFTLALSALVATSCKLGGSPSGAAASASASSAVFVPAPVPRPAPAPAAPASGIPKSFADLAAAADPAVVYVDTLQEQTGRSGAKRVLGRGLGSAFVFDPDGLILTNNHVIENASDIRVIFGKTRELKATVVGRDHLTDVAVLRVPAKGLPYLSLGDSDAVRVGDWVVAIGNPFGLAHTVSAGIVSAKERTQRDVQGLGDQSGYYNFIQTDASINPGNSGGPLLDTLGRVVGINTAIRARANNIGFAIPINMVKELLPQLTVSGKVRRSAMGLGVVPLLAQDADRLGFGETRGALVHRLQPGGPADRAGLRVDDLVVGLDGHEMANPEQLRWAVSLAGVGKEVNLRVLRGKRSFELKVKLDELKEEPQAPAVPEEPEDPLGGP